MLLILPVVCTDFCNSAVLDFTADVIADDSDVIANFAAIDSVDADSIADDAATDHSISFNSVAPPAFADSYSIDSVADDSFQELILYLLSDKARSEKVALLARP